MTDRPTELLAYIGTYTQGEDFMRGAGKGIYLFRLDLATGALTDTGQMVETLNPSYLTLHPTQPYLYCVNEQSLVDGSAVEGASAYRIDPATGALTSINRQPTHGTLACHLIVDTTGRYLIVSNYQSGSVAVLPILADGGLGPVTGLVQHEGSGVVLPRQGIPHPHYVHQDPTTGLIYVPDLSLDQVRIYELDTTQGRLTPYTTQPAARLHGGAGPRHLAVHPTLDIAYVIGEVDSTVTVYTKDPVNGTLAEIQTVPTLPADFGGQSWCAHILVHPNGRFVYGSNRGHDSIAVFAVDPATGKLTPHGHTLTGGSIPRNFAVDPTGAYLVAANQRSDDAFVFRLEEDGGKLVPVGGRVAVPEPVCVLFWQPV